MLVLGEWLVLLLHLILLMIFFILEILLGIPEVIGK